MTCGEFFLESKLMEFPSTNTIEYIYFHKDIFNMKDVPIQRYGIYCGVQSLWYLLLDCYNEEDIIDLYAERFCE